MLMEGFGFPRMAGRVFGALLMANPPEKSAEELAETLQASRGSISTSTRMLERMGLIDKVSKPGERKHFYRNKPGAFHDLMKREIEALSRLRQMAERGLAIIDSDDPEVRRGLEEMRDFYTYWEHEFPKLFRRWEAETQQTRDR